MVTTARPGTGAELSVRPPRSREPGALTEPPQEPRSAPQGRRILVVEDNHDAADSLHLLLTLLGHDVRVAYTGPEGVEVAAAWRPDIIISDIGLPGLDGYGVAREVRRHPATARACLIAITGYGSEDDRRRAHEHGFDHLLTKPADPAVLQQLLGQEA